MQVKILNKKTKKAKSKYYFVSNDRPSPLIMDTFTAKVVHCHYLIKVTLMNAVKPFEFLINKILI